MVMKLENSRCLREHAEEKNILSIIMEKLCNPERKKRPKTSRPSTVSRITANTSRRPFRAAARKRRRYNRKAIKQYKGPKKTQFDRASTKYGRIKYGFA